MSQVREKTVDLERAILDEKTIANERAIVDEKTIASERADRNEKTTTNERTPHTAGAALGNLCLNTVETPAVTGSFRATVSITDLG